MLAGGRSRRFGEADKVLAPVGDTPMIRHVADRIEPAVDRLVVSCRESQRADVAAALDGYPAPVETVVDPVPDRGPLAGMVAGLSALRAVADVTAEYALILAADLPLVTSGLIRRLFDAATGAGRIDAAVPRVDDWYRATCAVYRVVPTVGACRAALERGDQRARAPLAELGVEAVGEDDLATTGGPDALHDVDTPADRETAIRRLAGERA